MIIGTGLIGTSIALALRERGVRVWLADHDPAAARLAADIGRGEPWRPGIRRAGLAPNRLTWRCRGAARCRRGRPLAAAAGRRCWPRWYTDVASVKAAVLGQARDLGCDLASFVPGHPLSGRERCGPAAARADLFLGRPWVLCPAPETAPGATLPSRRWCAAAGPRRYGWPPPNTTARWRSSRTRRTWSPRRWRPGWRAPPGRRWSWPARGCGT